MANGKKIDINKQGLNSIGNETVKLNLMGKSKTMESKDWVDPQGRKGKVRLPACLPCLTALQEAASSQFATASSRATTYGLFELAA